MFVCQSCRCVSSILHLCVETERGGGWGVGVGRERETWLVVRETRREPAQVGCSRERQEGGAVVHGLTSRGGTDGWD